MKKNKVFSLLAVGLALGFVACNNSGNGTSSNDSASTTTTTATTTTTTTNYAARADTVRTNVSAGYYLNPRTGKAYTKLNVDPSTGAITDESGKPVRRYVDKRTWWVYDANSWDTVGSAQLHNGSLMYRGDNGSWEAYDKRWTDDATDNMNGTMRTDSGSASGATNSGSSNMDNTTNGKSKVKVTDNGNKVKIKKTEH